MSPTQQLATSLWLGSPRQYQKLYSKFDERDEGASLPFACFQDLRLCVVNKPFIPSMTFVFSTKYHYASLGDFIRYITTIPIPQRPVVHTKLRFFQMWQSLLRSADVNAFNIFCTQLVKSECVASFYHHLSEMQQWLDMKGPNSKPLFRPPAFTTLTEVHIAPFSNALIDWFVRSANASPTKRLSLGGFLGQRRCAIPIRRLHLPHLRHLTILGGLFTVSEISSFPPTQLTLRLSLSLSAAYPSYCRRWIHSQRRLPSACLQTRVSQMSPPLQPTRDSSCAFSLRLRRPAPI